MRASDGPIQLRVFLSSPGDVAVERVIARSVLEQLQYDPFVRGRVTFDVVAWDQPGGAPISATRTPQASVEAGLARPGECDIVIVILWSRMGTPLPVAEYTKPDGTPYLSGTEWEYEDAVRAGGPEVLVYRRSAKVLLDSDAPDLEERLRQRRLVNEFFARMRDPDTGALLRGHKRYEAPDDFRAELERDLRSLVHRLAGSAPPRRPAGPPSWAGSPFPGLRAFTPRDAPIFFGRGRETDELVARVTASGFVAVVGASGSGKSSLVGAGLLPRLEQSGAGWVLPRFAGGSWSGLRFTPGEAGDDPFLAAAARLAHGSNAAALAQALCAEPESVVDHLPAGTSLIFVDQFEELFTVVDPARVPAWTRLLEAAAGSGRCHVVVTLRADFYHRCLEIPRLARLLEAGQLPLGAPTDTLLDMITRPAQRADLTFEEGLPGRILRDTGADPDALPLLAYTLDELYRAGTELLDHATYARLGGVQGAIGTRAEHVFTTLLDDAARSAFSRVFRNLVRVEEDGRATRRRALLTRLAPDDPARRFVDVLTSARLLVQNKDEHNRPVGYVAHEALFGSWDRLAIWIRATRDDLLLEHKVTAAAAEWAAHGRDEAYLWPHERLEPVYAMVERRGATLDPVTTAFIEPEYERLFPLLDHEIGHRRQNVIDRLVAIGAVTVPGLLAILTGPPGGARYAAGSVLGRLGEPAIPGLIDALGHTDRSVRLIALGGLRRIAEPSTAPAVARALDDPTQEVRSAAVGVLEALGGPEARRLLGTAAASGEPDVRWLAAGALGAFGPDAVPHLLAVGDEDEQALRSAHRALLAICKQDLEPLFEGLWEGDARTRLNAATALAALGRPAVTGLLNALAGNDPDVRWHACEALAAIGNGNALPTLVLTLEDVDPAIRCAAAHALGAIGDRAAEKRLTTRLADEDHVVRWAAADALVRIAGTRSAYDLLKTTAMPGPSGAMASAVWISFVKPEMLNGLPRDPAWLWERVADAAASWGETAVPDLLDLLRHPVDRQKEAAARVLAAMGPVAVHRLIAHLRHGDPAVRSAAARALGWIGAGEPTTVGPLDDPGARRALPALRKLLDDSDARCRDAAAEALAGFGEDALSAVWWGLSAKSRQTREAAARAAVGIGGVAVPGLLAMADNPAAWRHAIEALRQIGTPAALFGLAELGIGPERAQSQK